jgi:hypothetical protein
MNAWGPPETNECSPFYRGYIERMGSTDVHAALEQVSLLTEQLLQRIPPRLSTHRYADGKWTISEVFQHLVDCERIMQYRALRFARNDATELPGFDEDEYARQADTSTLDLREIADELAAVRRSSQLLFRSFPDHLALRQGVANGNPVTVRALGWIIAGHTMHHLQILQQRYLTHEPA